MTQSAENGRVLVSGATGRLGHVLVTHLIEAGFQVRATDQRMARDMPVDVEVADLTRADVCYGLCEGVQAVIHLANIPSSGYTDPQRLVWINHTSNFNIFQAAVAQGARKLIFASSIQILGTRRRLVENAPDNDAGFTLPLSERTPIAPDNEYALSKQMGEETLRYFCQNFGVSGIALRFPWLRPKSYLIEGRTSRRYRSSRLPDYVAWLVQDDAATLCEALLRANLPGYRVYLPSATEANDGGTLQAFYQRWYQATRLERPLEELESLVDIQTVVRETGWRPRTIAEFRAEAGVAADSVGAST
ncbi:MAG: NAD-dependent epimerase/dehydratase family protein [Opitutales bacterium]